MDEGSQVPIPDEQVAAEQFDAQAAEAARRAVDETQLAQFPNTVTDKEKAVDMAAASKASEIDIVNSAGRAKEFAAAALPGEQVSAELDGTIKRAMSDRKSKSYYETAEYARDYMVGQAQESREKADAEAQVAAETYDRNQEAMAKVDALKRGKSFPEPASEQVPTAEAPKEEQQAS